MIRTAKLRSFRGMTRFTPPVETSRHETEPLHFVVRELPNCWVVTDSSILRTPRHQVNESFTPNGGIPGEQQGFDLKSHPASGLTAAKWDFLTSRKRQGGRTLLTPLMAQM